MNDREKEVNSVLVNLISELIFSLNISHVESFLSTRTIEYTWNLHLRWMYDILF